MVAVFQGDKYLAREITVTQAAEKAEDKKEEEKKNDEKQASEPK